MGKSDADTMQLPTSADPERSLSGISSRTTVDVAALSHVGKKRTNNEDSFLVTRFGRNAGTVATNLPPELEPRPHAEVGYAMLVADGMGGAAGGEVASQLAITALVDFAIDTPDWILSLEESWADHVIERMKKRFEGLRGVLKQQVRMDPSLTGMGTTLTLAVSLGPSLIIAHLGDSRVYVYTLDKLLPLTKDHTMAQLLADMGVITHDDAQTHHARHVLTGAITADANSTDVEFRLEQLRDGDQLLLCSDGLTEMVDDSQIAAVLAEKLPAKDSCQKLIDLALEAGGKDNVTVIVARYQIPPG